MYFILHNMTPTSLYLRNYYKKTLQYTTLSFDNVTVLNISGNRPERKSASCNVLHKSEYTGKVTF